MLAAQRAPGDNGAMRRNVDETLRAAERAAIVRALVSDGRAIG